MSKPSSRRKILALVLGAGLCLPVLALAVRPRLSADRILVEKSARRLTLYRQSRPVKVYLVALGPEPFGPKRCQGDNRTPEGTYRIDYRNPNSAFHRSLHITYPNAADRAQSSKLRCSPGGDIMIHGLPNGQGEIGARHRLVDWTAGCIAVTNEEIEEIWNAIPDGTEVEIRP